MPDLSKILREEIARVARKQLRGEVDALKKTLGQQRHAIAALRRELDALARQTKRLAKPGRRVQASAAAEADKEQGGRQIRFSAQRLAAHRAKLGISAEHYGKLVGASALSVYKWEKGQVRPRRAQLEALAAVRGLGKREVMQRLAG